MTHDVTIRSDDEFGVGIACRMVRERARADGGTTSHEPPPPSIVEWSTSTHDEKFHDILTVLYSLLSSYEKNEKMQSTEEEEKKEKEKEKEKDASVEGRSQTKNLFEQLRKKQHDGEIDFL